MSVAGNVKSAPKLAEVLAGKVTESAIPLLKVISGEMIVHCAYRVKFEVVVTTPLVAIEDPLPFAAVFQPANVYPIFTSEPELLSALNVVPVVRVPAFGTVPPVEPLPL